MKTILEDAPAPSAYSRHQLPSPLATLLSILHSPLTRNGYALVMSAGITSVLGLLFWIIAARLYTAEQVGVGAAMLAALLTLGNIAQLNLDTVLNRFLPIAGTRTKDMIAWSYAASVMTALVISLVFILATALIAPRLSFLADSIWLALVFMISCAVWALFALQDSVLAGLRKSTWIPLENTAYSVAKIGALMALTATATVQAPIFLAWVAPLPIVVFIMTIGIFRYLVPLNALRGEAGSALTRSSLIRFFGWDYAGSIAMMLAMGGAPLLVLNLTGAESMAGYHLAWTITSSLYLIGRSMGISLLAEGAADESRMKSLTADALVHTFLLLSATLIVVIPGAHIIMSLFGPQYVAEGVPLLRILALSCLPWSMITIFLAVARANGHLVMVAGVQFATMVLTLGLGAPLLYGFGTIGMGVAWLVTHTLVLVGIGFHIANTRGRGSLLDWLLAIASSLSRLASTMLHRGHTNASLLEPEKLHAILRDSGIERASTLSVLVAVPTQSDVQTLYIGADNHSNAEASVQRTPEQAALLLLKTAHTPSGITSLERYVSQVRQLKTDPRLADWPVRLPMILHYCRNTTDSYLVERKLPGDDGRVVFRKPELASAALSAAADAVNNMHTRTAAETSIDENWLSRWINQPAEALAAPISTLMSARHRQVIIHTLIAELRQFWTDQTVPLGLGHGDCSPGNILFLADQCQPEAAAGQSSNLIVSAIIDWGTASGDAPPGLDLCHLLLTTRMLLTGQELGQVVCDLLLTPRWSEEEAKLLSVPFGLHPHTRSWPDQPEAIRALVGLAWLHHVKSNMEKSTRYKSSRLWTAWNVERVLQTFQRTSSPALP